MAGGAPQDNLPAEAVLVRFGISKAATLRENALVHAERLADNALPVEYALSCDYRLGHSAAEIALQSTTPNAPAYRQMRQTTVRRMNEIGLSVVPEGDREGHGRIELGPQLDDEVVKRVEAAFDPPEPNPRYEMS